MMEQTTENQTIADHASATGRRKEAACRVDVKLGKGDIKINGLPKKDYLNRDSLIQLIMQPLENVEMETKLDVSVKVAGGGKSGQAGAIRLAIARALCQYDPEFRPALKKAGLLTVDARKVERKKYGRPKARKRFQFSKR
jgi:small subunit ribosomal protein S9